MEDHPWAKVAGVNRVRKCWNGVICFECGEPACHDHHVVPRSRGGTKTVPLCGLCHSRAHNDSTGRLAIAQARRTVAKFGWRMAGGFEVPDSKEQAALAAIVQANRDGLSLVETAQRLTAEGHKTRTGRPWRTVIIQRYTAKAGLQLSWVHHIRLSAEQRAEIKRDFKPRSRTYGSKALAKKYGVHYTTILFWAGRLSEGARKRWGCAQ